MKLHQKEKKFHVIGLLITLLFSAAILSLGYLLISGMQYWIPSYKNKMTYMGEENVQMQPLYWNREEEITIYPWGLYKTDAAMPLTDNDKEFLKNACISDLLNQAVPMNEETDFISHFEKVTSNNAPIYFLKDFECIGYPFVQTDAEQPASIDNIDSTFKQTKIIHCAVDQYGQLLYLHVVDKDRLENPADRTKIESAYHDFTISQDTGNTSRSDILGNAAMDLYNLIVSNSYQYQAAVALEDFFHSDNSAYDVVIQNQQILLIYTLDSGYRFIFIYNVPMERVVGISLEKLFVSYS